MIQQELKDKIISEGLIPSYEEIAKELGVGKNTVYNVMNGSSAATKISKKVEEYILRTAAETAEKRKSNKLSILED